MSRFQFNEDDYDEANDYDDDDFFEDEQDELIEHMYMLSPYHPSNQYIKIAQAAMDLNQKMVRLSVEVAGNSWFWRWRRLDKKLSMIANAHKKLSKLLEIKKEDKDAKL
jgi:hypothetical protein